MVACVGAHQLSRKLKAFGHDARVTPATCSKGQKNDFRDAEAIAEAVQRRRSVCRISPESWLSKAHEAAYASGVVLCFSTPTPALGSLTASRVRSRCPLHFPAVCVLVTNS